MSRAGMPAGIAGADHRPDRRAGDAHRAKAEIVQRLEDVDVGEPAGAAATKCQSEPHGLPPFPLRRRPDRP